MVQKALTIYQPNLLIESYCLNLKTEAINTRRYFMERMDSANSILDLCYREHPSTCNKVKDIQASIQTITKGVPATESVMDVGLTTELHQEAVANALLLKKAYRQAASVAHPDKGGSHEDFTAINAAYKAGDLTSLTEYVLAKEKTLLEQIEYWKQENLRPEVAWKRFQSTPQFRVIQVYMSGNKALAKQLSKTLLDALYTSLIQQEHQILKEYYGYKTNQSPSESG